jgi:catechol 2,3-dioxygenase-like lactoylglutathione lyase family enzyme
MATIDSGTNPGADSGADSGAAAPILAGIHHLKLPVTDLARSLDWYRSRLGYQVQVEFVEQGTLMGVGLAHPAGGPDLGLRLDPDRARAAPGSTTSPSACRTSPPSTTSPAGWTSSARLRR